jgi:hypothetical protein
MLKKRVIVPKSFTFKKSNIADCITFFNEILNVKNTKISIDYSNIIQIDKFSVLLLIAHFQRSQTKGNEFLRTGKLPLNKKARAILQNSKGMEVFNKNVPKTTNNKDIKKDDLLNPNVIDGIIKNLKEIGASTYYYPFYNFLQEVIGNAVEHGIKEKKIQWYILQDLDRKNKKMTYCFVDLGKGIVNSHKEAKLPFKYRFLPNRRIVADSIQGKLLSSTKDPNRGRGLPEIYQLIRNKEIGEVNLITNTVSLHFENNKIITKDIPNFNGTCFIWSINYENYTTWMNTL